MTLLNSWLNPATQRLLALSLLHFIWQGTALAALAYTVMAFCRSAAARYAVGVGTMALMLAAPPITFLALRSQEQPIPPTITANEAKDAEPVTARDVLLWAQAATYQRETEMSQPYSLWLLEFWFAGVVLLSLRSAGGILLIERLRRKETIPVPDDILQICLSLQRRMGLTRAIRYCESLHLDAPAVAGWIRPVVLLPMSAISGLTTTQLEAVIAHELAHIRRYDPFINLFQVAVETLLFYHPAVWWIGRRVRAEREHCCDDAAVTVCGSVVTYVRALASMAESKAAPQLAMAANRSPLVRRITRLLGANRAADSFRGANLSAGVLCLSAALLAGAALLGSVHRVEAQTPTPAATPAVSSPRAETRAPSTLATKPAIEADSSATSISINGYGPSATARVTAPDTLPAEPAPAPSAGPVPAQEKSAAPQAAPRPAPEGEKQSYIDSLSDAGLKDLTVDQLIALKVQGITAAYIKSMKDLNINPDVNTLVGLKVQGVTPDYVKGMRDATGQALNTGELIGLKVQGITPEYVKQMHDLGLKANAGEVIGMKIQGVTPEYIQQMRGLGLKTDGGNIIAMKIQGVNPDYVRQMRDLGLKLDTGELIAMKIQGVSPEYVKEFNDMGLHPSTDELIQTKIQGVNAEYLKELQGSGYNASINDAIAAKIQGITPEFIAKVRNHGFKDLTLKKLIALKQSGVFDAEK
jgi:beta-lactamase regulating signal transducer with metallopeptidase domain